MSESYVYAFRRLDLIRDNLYHALQKTNRISAWKLAETAHDFQRVDDVLREAGMVEYLPCARLWVPGVGTYDWLVKQRERMLCTTTANKPN